MTHGNREPAISGSARTNHPPTPGDLLAESRIARHEARNLLESISTTPAGNRAAVRAESRALYAKARELADAAPGRAVTDPACPDCPGQATPGHQCSPAGGR